MRGIRIAHLSYAYGFNGLPLPADAPWSANLIDAGRIHADAARARQEGAALVVVSLHWGTEYRAAPDGFQESVVSQLLPSEDIDLVIGHHAHVVQPVRKVGATYVVFGLGNELSNQSEPPRRDGLTVVASAGPSFGRWRFTGLQIVPTWVDLAGHRVLPGRARPRRPGHAARPRRRPAWLLRPDRRHRHLRRRTRASRCRRSRADPRPDRTEIRVGRYDLSTVRAQVDDRARRLIEPAPPGSGGWIRRLWPFLAARRRDVFLAFGASIVGMGLSALTPLVTKVVVDDVVGDGEGSITPWLVALMGIAVVTFVGAYVRRYVGGRVALDVQYDLRTAIFERLQRLDFAGHDQHADRPARVAGRAPTSACSRASSRSCRSSSATS